MEQNALCASLLRTLLEADCWFVLQTSPLIAGIRKEKSVTDKVMQTFILYMHYEELLFMTLLSVNQPLFLGAFFHVRGLPELSSIHWWRSEQEVGIDFFVIAYCSASFPWSLKAMRKKMIHLKYLILQDPCLCMHSIRGTSFDVDSKFFR